MPVEMIIMLVGLGLGGHFGKALEDSGKENFTKDEILSIHASSIAKISKRNSKKSSRKPRKQSFRNWEFFLNLEFRNK